MREETRDSGWQPDQIGNRAGELFDEGLYCAESVALALTEQSGTGTDLIPAIATGFCSGMARTGGQCGAVSGAVMGIGLVCGRARPDEEVAPAYECVQKLLEQFRDRFGSTNCYELIECDLLTDEGHQRFEQENLIEQCRQYTVEAATMAAIILKESR